MPHDPPPAPKPHWEAIDRLPDEELLRFAPPEIRRLHRKVAAIEAGQQRLAEELTAIRGLLERMLARQGG